MATMYQCGGDKTALKIPDNGLTISFVLAGSSYNNATDHGGSGTTNATYTFDGPVQVTVVTTEFRNSVSLTVNNNRITTNQTLVIDANDGVVSIVTSVGGTYRDGYKDGHGKAVVNIQSI